MTVDVEANVLEDADCAATLDGAESDRVNDGGGDGLDREEASSSFGLSSREISTLEDWCQDWPQGYEEVGRFGWYVATLITGSGRRPSRYSRRLYTLATVDICLSLHRLCWR